MILTLIIKTKNSARWASFADIGLSINNKYLISNKLKKYITLHSKK